MIGLLRLLDGLRHRARSRQWSPEQTSGRRGEDLAHRLLREQGLTVVARNFRPRSGHGEIDLVAWEKDKLVFVEVKARRTDEFGTPDRAVDAAKRDALIRSAREYAHRAGVPWERVRFDIVNVILTEPLSVTRIPAAFRPRQAL